MIDVSIKGLQTMTENIINPNCVTVLQYFLFCSLKETTDGCHVTSAILRYLHLLQDSPLKQDSVKNSLINVSQRRLANILTGSKH